MKFKNIAPLFLITFFALFISVSYAVETEKFLSGKHIKLEFECADCHNGEKKPVKKADIKACLDCHGGYEGVRALTAKLEINPHDSHEGDIECGECHKSHEPSIDYCEQCHTYSFIVP